MITVEVRNLYVDYKNKDEHSCSKKQASMAAVYIIKQLVRMVQLKQLKNTMEEIELIVPDNIAKTLQRMDSRNRSGNGNSGNTKSS